MIRSESLARELENTLRLLRSGSGPDRVLLRAKLLDRADEFVPILAAEIQKPSGNHFVQRQIALILMEARDARAAEALLALAGGGHGDRGVAGLALGKVPARGAVEALRKLQDDSHAPWPRAAVLALGRIDDAAATPRIEGWLQRARQDLDKETGLVALGARGEPRLLRTIESYAASTSDSVRRAAATALAMLGECGRPRLFVLAKDPDPAVRMAALAGLAVGGEDSSAFEALAKARLTARSGLAAEEARAVLAAAVLGGASAVETVAEAARHRDARVRAAAAAAGLAAPLAAHVRTAQTLLSDPDDDVRLVALLTVIADAARNQRRPLLSILVGARDPRFRRAVVFGETYLAGAGARGGIEALLGSDQEDDTRAAARAAIGWLDRDAEAARGVGRAELQRLADDLGIAPSWNVLADANGFVQRVLEVEDAIARGGGGASGTGSAATRSLAAAANRVTAEEEDLHRHLERHPYFDRRARIEMPPPPRL